MKLLARRFVQSALMFAFVFVFPAASIEQPAHMWMTNYYDADGNIVGSCDRDCNGTETCWGVKTASFDVYDMGTCELIPVEPPPPEGPCYLWGMYWEECPDWPNAGK